MGKYNSSKFRVTPLMDAIKGNQTRFDAFLKKVEPRPILGLVCPRENSQYFYGSREKKLKPTKEHLLGLLRYMAEKAVGEADSTIEKRRDLYGLNGKARRAEALREAQLLIEETYNAPLLPKEWYIFEGATCPDAYIEGEDYVIVCEGKWTEGRITETTAHLRGKGEHRDQMVRHIQGALNATDKRVYAFYIVDAECGYIGDLTPDAFAERLDRETVPPEEGEKKRILDSFCGYTTWELLGDALGISFPSKEEIDRADKT